MYHRPLDVASSHSPQQLTTSAMFQQGKGRVSPSFYGRNLKGAHTPPPRHLIGQNVFTWSPQLQEKLGTPCAHVERQYKGRRGNGHWGTACSLPYQAKGWLSQRMIQGMLRGREALPHTLSMAQKVSNAASCFILSCPRVCGR